MIPVVVQLGPFPIHSFGLMLVAGIIAGWWRLALSLKESNMPVELAEKVAFWGAIAGILGARLFYLASNPAEFIADPLGMLFSQAGFVYFGSLIFGTLTVWYIVRRAGFDFLPFADLAACPLILGYGIGRIGCHLSGDGDYGIPSQLPWAVSYSLGVVPTPPGVLVHPTPVYETLAALLIAYFLYWLQRTKMLSQAGQLFGIYLILVGIERFLIEIIRIEPVILLGLTQAQVISIASAVLGLVLLFRAKAVTV